eukprot:TRINITY_DN2908_c0_g2_i1.p1 TRINITY_DN2908_c0_g2~~TRINITY_DN2908_c0_g2_i1.p1  ORF type:complete len:316 (-),score=28.94 TRINITY_DN2908_c0_g2_i1:171-1118(-)
MLRTFITLACFVTLASCGSLMAYQWIQSFEGLYNFATIDSDTGKLQSLLGPLPFGLSSSNPAYFDPIHNLVLSQYDDGGLFQLALVNPKTLKYSIVLLPSNELPSSFAQSVNGSFYATTHLNETVISKGFLYFIDPSTSKATKLCTFQIPLEEKATWSYPWFTVNDVEGYFFLQLLVKPDSNHSYTGLAQYSMSDGALLNMFQEPQYKTDLNAFALASYEGVVYGANVDGFVWKLDVTSGNATVILDQFCTTSGGGGGSPDATFDLKNGFAFVVDSCGSFGPSLFKINLQTGNFTVTKFDNFLWFSRGFSYIPGS